MGKFWDIHFVLQKSTNPQIKHFFVQEICWDMFEVVDVWITVSFPTLFLEKPSTEILQKLLKNATVLAFF